MLRTLEVLLALKVRQRVFFSFILCIGMIIGNSSSLIYVNTQFSGDIQALL